MSGTVGRMVPLDGAKIRAARKRRLLTLGGVGEPTGMSRVNLSRIENGHQGCRPSSLVALADALLVEPRDLLCDSVASDWTLPEPPAPRPSTRRKLAPTGLDRAELRARVLDGISDTLFRHDCGVTARIEHEMADAVLSRIDDAIREAAP